MHTLTVWLNKLNMILFLHKNLNIVEESFVFYFIN